MATVIVKKGRARPLWCGHPWLMSGAVARVEGDVTASGVVRVADNEGRTIGVGLYNEASQIRVRLIARGEVSDDLNAIVLRGIERAVTLRRSLGLPSAETTGFRVVNAEGDNLPGLVVDRFGETIVAQFTARAMWGARDTVARAFPHAERFVSYFPADAAKQEGMGETGQRASTGVGASAGAGAGTGSGASGQASHADLVEFKELGLGFIANVGRGQKTGFYFDQREARARLAALARGTRILDLFSYSGGFALNAARGGARAVTAVDSSAPAIAIGRENAEKNGLSRAIEWVEDDALRFVIERGRAHEEFDIVIVDPPKLARRDADLRGALERYRRLNAEAMRVVRDGFILTCTCSAAVSRDEFERAIALATSDAGVTAQVVWRGGAGPDHPTIAAHAEADYLKSTLLRVTRI